MHNKCQRKRMYFGIESDKQQTSVIQRKSFFFSYLIKDSLSSVDICTYILHFHAHLE